MYLLVINCAESYWQIDFLPCALGRNNVYTQLNKLKKADTQENLRNMAWQSAVQCTVL